MPESTALHRRIIRQASIIALALLESHIILNIIAGQQYLGIGQIAPLWALMLTIGIGSLVYAEIVSCRIVRRLRAAERGETSAASPAEPQPDPTLALRPGETLTLTCLTRPDVFKRQLLLAVCLAPVGFVMVGGIGELYSYLALPHALGWLATFLDDPGATSLPVLLSGLSLLGWTAFLTPIILALLFVGAVLLEPFMGRRQEIIVDDAGLTIQRSQRRRRIIAWSDMLQILRSDNGVDTVYCLCSRGRNVTFAFSVAAPALAPNGKPLGKQLIYSGGVEAYLVGLERMVATLTIRAHMPLRLWPASPTNVTKQPATAPYDGIRSLEQALALPIADRRIQPTPAEMEQARTLTGDRLMLRDRIPYRALVPQTRKNMILYGSMMTTPIVAIFLGGAVHGGLASLLRLSDVVLLAVALALGAMLGIFVTVVEYRDYVSPSVAATCDGLALLKFNGRPLHTVAWEDIRACAILAPSSDATDPAGCVIWTEERILEWREPQGAQLAGRTVLGNRQEAYRTTARLLHALIAARTDLPMHAIQPRTVQSRGA